MQSFIDTSGGVGYSIGKKQFLSVKWAIVTNKRLPPDDLIDELVRRAKNGDKWAYNKLEREIIPQIVNCVLSYKLFPPPGMDMDELHSIGVKAGITEAYEKFDPKKGLHFRTYASFIIRFRIIDAIRKTVGPGNYEIWRAFMKAKEALKEKLGCEPEDMEVIEYMKSKGLFPKYTSEKLISVINHVRGTSYSLDEQCEEGGETLLEMIDSGERNPADEVILRAILEECLDRLNERERAVIYRHFYKDESIADIAKDLHVTNEAIYRNKWDALEKLRDCFEGED